MMTKNKTTAKLAYQHAANGNQDGATRIVEGELRAASSARAKVELMGILAEVQGLEPIELRRLAANL